MLNRTVLPICLCFLVLAAVLATGMALDPDGFSLKAWQPITAALIALIAAMFAYFAAMRKLHFDEQIVKENERRKALGVFMRFEFAVDVLEYEAGNLLEEIEPPEDSSENDSVVVDDLALSEMPEVNEAWQNLDYFPVALSKEFYEVKNELYNFAQFKKDHAGKCFPSEYGMIEPEELGKLRGILKDLHQDCVNALVTVGREIVKLRKQVI